MSGHISMMNDVLISQLQPSLLRSALRSLLTQLPNAAGIFVSHVRARLKESPLPHPDPAALFPKGSTEPSLALKEYLASARCYFSSHLVRESLPYLTHLFEVIPASGARWAHDSDLEGVLEAAAHDTVQSVQALKESREDADSGLRSLLYDLLRAVSDCAEYCRAESLTFPLARAQLQVTDAIRILFPAVELNGYASSHERMLELDPTQSIQSIETVRVGSMEIPRLLNGLWQMSSPAWGTASSDKVDSALLELIQAGLVAADMADHYGDAELLYGSFRNRLPPSAGAGVLAATKWCVFSPLKEPVSRELVLAAVQERTRRLGGRADMLQLHWQDYSDKSYLLIIELLFELTKARPDLVGEIGLCNFDSDTTAEICEYMLSKTGEVGVVSNQVQYSLIDSRPSCRMAAVCEKYGLKLLTYGSFCGGFLSDRWLSKPAPDVYAESEALTPSQRKYFDMIREWGTWPEFQALLRTLRDIADSHGGGIDISNVATRWVLQQPAVGAVIVGSRLGVTSHVGENARVFGFQLSGTELASIEKAALEGKRDALFLEIGDCGAEYR